jgi:hypothetical protein
MAIGSIERRFDLRKAPACWRFSRATPKRSVRIRNKRTLVREAEEALGRTRDPNEIVDMLHVIETPASRLFLRAATGKNAGRDPSHVDANYQRAALGYRPPVPAALVWPAPLN